MSKLSFSREQMKKVLSELKLGGTVLDVSHKYGIAPRTLYRWRAKLSRKRQSARERLRSLEIEHQRLKRQFAELTLDYTALRAALMEDVKRDC